SMATGSADALAMRPIAFKLNAFMRALPTARQGGDRRQRQSPSIISWASAEFPSFAKEGDSDRHRPIGWWRTTKFPSPTVGIRARLASRRHNGGASGLRTGWRQAHCPIWRGIIPEFP